MVEEQVGLLFVHGVGEQKRWEHLRSSVGEFAELMRLTGSRSHVVLIDRTADWLWLPGRPHPEGLAPVTLVYDGVDESGEHRRIHFQCFEVWWAEMGAGTTIQEKVVFWLWGLGQWCAPIYKSLNAAGAGAGALTYVPKSVAGDMLKEPRARLHLLMAALTALFTVVTWGLLKRVAGVLVGRTPLPTLVQSYVGDVRTYEARAAPGDTAPTDPGHPRRVGIRRRMVQEMVAMGARPDLARWYVLAHSLGTVVAYNGLTETGHALPNYLSWEQWQALPAHLRHDPGCRMRDDVDAMMPSRPPWLTPRDVINRPLLFGKLCGFLTYGSPLDKFAGLWPRIVATARDRSDGQHPLGNCEWINLAAPSDPVAGTLEGLPAHGPGDPLERVVPAVRNYWAPWDLLIGISHIRYFSGFEAFRRNHVGEAQKVAVAEWLVGRELRLSDVPLVALRRLATFVQYLGLIIILWLAASWLVRIILEGASRIVGTSASCSGCIGRGVSGVVTLATASPGEALLHILRLPATVLGASFALIFLMGALRWFRESGLNLRLAEDERPRDPDPDKVSLSGLLGRQRNAALLLGTVGLAVILFSLLIDLGWTTAPFRFPAGYWTLTAAAVGSALCAWTQTFINRARRG